MMSGREPWEPNDDFGYREIVPFPQSLVLAVSGSRATNSDTNVVFKAVGNSHNGDDPKTGAVAVGPDRDMILGEFRGSKVC